MRKTVSLRLRFRPDILPQRYFELKWFWWHHAVCDLKLVTIFGSWWRNFDINDISEITSFECWCSTLMQKDSRCWWPKWPIIVTNILKQSSKHFTTSVSPTSVTNIDITINCLLLNTGILEKWIQVNLWQLNSGNAIRFQVILVPVDSKGS